MFLFSEPLNIPQRNHYSSYFYRWGNQDAKLIKWLIQSPTDFQILESRLKLGTSMSDHNSLPIHIFENKPSCQSSPTSLCKSYRGCCRLRDRYFLWSLVQITISTHLPLLVPTHKLTPPQLPEDLYFYHVNQVFSSALNIVLPLLHWYPLCQEKGNIFLSYAVTYILWFRNHKLNHKFWSVHLFMIWGPCSLSFPSPALFEAIHFGV